MKKALSVLLVILLSLFLLCACDLLSDEPSRAVPEESADVNEAAATDGSPDGTALPPDTAAIPAVTDPAEEEPSRDETEPSSSSVPEPSSDAVTEPAPVTVPDKPEVSGFEIYFLDVGQGDAACVICDGRAMMIDGGPAKKSDLIYSFLRSHGIEHLEYIVASHPDADHVGGLAGALNYATVGTAYCSTTQYNTKTFNDFIKYLERQNKNITVPNTGDTFRLGSAEVTVVFPDAGVTMSDNTSIVLRIVYGETSFLFTGDCQLEDELVFLNNGYSIKCDVLKIAHHGSSHSTSSELLRLAAPSYAVISVGGDNDYGHPTETVLNNVKANGITLYRTDMQGDIHCTSDGKKIVFDVEKNAGADVFIAAGGYNNYLDRQAEKDRELASEQTSRNGGDAQEDTVTYIVNTNTGKFHRPGCSSVDKMAEKNKWEFTGTREELIALGYSPCGRCNP